MPEMPAPTISTSTCSGDRSGRRTTSGVTGRAASVDTGSSSIPLGYGRGDYQHTVDYVNVTLVTVDAVYDQRHGRAFCSQRRTRGPRPAGPPRQRRRPRGGDPRHRGAAAGAARAARDLRRRPGTRRRHLPPHVLLLLPLEGRRAPHPAGPHGRGGPRPARRGARAVRRGPAALAAPRDHRHLRHFPGAPGRDPRRRRRGGHQRRGRGSCGRA